MLVPSDTAGKEVLIHSHCHPVGGPGVRPHTHRDRDRDSDGLHHKHCPAWAERGQMITYSYMTQFYTLYTHAQTPTGSNLTTTNVLACINCQYNLVLLNVSLSFARHPNTANVFLYILTKVQRATSSKKVSLCKMSTTRPQ